MKILHERNLGKQKSFLAFLPWIIFSAGLFLTFLAWRLTESAFFTQRALEFDSACIAIQFRISERINLYMDALYGGQGLFAASKEVDRSEWRSFIQKQDVIGRYPGIAAMEFVERVNAEAKEAFTESVRKDSSLVSGGYPEFTIHPAAVRPEYFVVKYIEPMEGNEDAFGYDLGSEPVRMEAFNRARDEDKPAITAAIRFSRLKGVPEGFLIAAPVYQNGMPKNTLEERRKSLSGFVVGVVRTRELFQHLFLPERNPKVDFEIFDGNSLTKEAILFDSSPAAHLEFPESKLKKKVWFHTGGREWQILFSAMPGFGEDWAEKKAVILVAGGGVVLSFLLSGMTGLLITSQSRAVDLAGKMTKELRVEIEKRKKISAHQAVLYRAIESANKELSDFVYVVSHDLKAPLRGIHSLAAWIVEDKKEQLDDDGRSKLRLMIERVDRMAQLIDGVLEYSRLGKVREELTAVDLNQVVRDVLEIAPPPASVRIEVVNPLPVLNCEKTRMRQVFLNLITNAVKFMDKPAGVIRIGCQSRGNLWEFYVRDNGPGIAPESHEKIFQMFQTVPGAYNKESSGIGLALVKKIVEMYGGKIRVESERGKGSVFYFTFPHDIKPVS